jgi:hypothetical protein
MCDALHCFRSFVADGRFGIISLPLSDDGLVPKITHSPMLQELQVTARRVFLIFYDYDEPGITNEAKRIVGQIASAVSGDAVCNINCGRKYRYVNQ